MKAKKTAMIIAMTAMFAGEKSANDAAAQAAVMDMQKEFGKDMVAMTDPFELNYTWDPSDGFCA